MVMMVEIILLLLTFMLHNISGMMMGFGDDDDADVDDFYRSCIQDAFK